MKHKPHSHRPIHHQPAKQTMATLAGARPGHEVAIVGFAGGAGDLHERLLAYGLIPGRTLRVLAQKPLTVVQIEHTELALERELAQCVEIAGG